MPLWRIDKMKKGERTRFCFKGHDKDIVGRTSDSRCAECTKFWKIAFRKRHKKEIKEYLERNKERIRNREKEYYKKNKEKIKKWIEEHKEEIAIKRKEYDKEYRKRHPEKHSISNIKQQTNRNLRIVSWTDWGKIKEFYKNKPEGMEGDHIIPLQGKLVSGLHVSWNLQYMFGLENNKKNKKIDLMSATKLYEKILIDAGLK